MKKLPNHILTGMMVISLLVVQVILFVAYLLRSDMPLSITLLPIWCLIVYAILKYVIMMCKLIWIAMTSHDDYGKDK